MQHDEAKEIYIEDGNIEEESVNESEDKEAIVEMNRENEDIEEREISENNYIDQLRRLKAEFHNYKKRTEKEKEQLTDYIESEFIKDLLSVIDDFERLLKHADVEEDKLAGSVDLIYRSFMGILKNKRLKPIESIGEQFDPNLHEAVLVDHNEEFENNEILEEWRKGYLFKDKLLRPAQVKVNKTED